jgi:hypothetical protein
MEKAIEAAKNPDAANSPPPMNEADFMRAFGDGGLTLGREG